MIKSVIKFENGDYWYCYTLRGPDVNEAWTFNKDSGAQNTINTNKLTGCSIINVTRTFTDGGAQNTINTAI